MQGERLYKVARSPESIPYAWDLTLKEAIAVRDDVEVFMGKLHRIYNQRTGQEIR